MPPKRLCLFAHFDPQGKIEPYVLYYLQCLKELECDIVFVSSALNLTDSEVEKILGLCVQVIHRKNITLDFGSWRLGLFEKLSERGFEHYDQLILANDSVYGPLFPLKDVFQKMEKRELDLWGITSNLEIEEHIQSYFLVFGKNALKSREFIEFWRDFKYYRSKQRIIELYEIGISRLAMRAGWKMGTLIDPNHFQEIDLNPTLYHWDQLIVELSCPFLKTEVLRLNRTASKKTAQWKEILASKSNYDLNLIECDIKRRTARTESNAESS